MIIVISMHDLDLASGKHFVILAIIRVEKNVAKVRTSAIVSISMHFRIHTTPTLLVT